MIPKIVLFDVDGTLLQNGVIPDSTREAIVLLQKKGIHTAIATGRNVRDGGVVADELGIPHLVSFNGARVQIEGQEVFSNSFHSDAMELITDYTKKHDIPMVIHTADQTVSNSPEHPDIVEILSGWGIQLPELGGHNGQPVFQVNLYMKDQHDPNVLSLFPDGVFLYRWHDKAIDLQPVGTGKAVGTAKLLEKYGLLPGEAIAFGDGGNDIDMLSYVGTGIAMGNATPSVKQAADLVTDSVHENGIWNALKKLEVI